MNSPRVAFVDTKHFRERSIEDMVPCFPPFFADGSSFEVYLDIEIIELGKTPELILYSILLHFIDEVTGVQRI